MARGGVLLLISGLLASTMGGCGPSQEEFDQERAKVRELQAQLAQSTQRRQSLEEKLQELTDQNAQITEQLRLAGESLEQSEGTRRTLQEQIGEMRRAIEELRARERQAQARLATFRSLLDKFRSMIEGGKLRVRIVRNRMVVELPEGILFASGKAELKDEGEVALTQVGQILGSIEDRFFQIAGHTDNVPIRTRRFPSNWELSAKRAVNVARFLIEQGMSAERLSAAGYADTQPVATNDTDEGRQQNRRIEIVLVPNLDELPDLSSLQELTGED